MNDRPPRLRPPGGLAFSPMQTSVHTAASGTTRTYRSLIDAPVQDLVAWHTNPGAFERLTPPWMPARIVAGDTSTNPGSRVTLRVPILGPVGFAWSLVHDTLTDGTGFADVQLSGPFRAWRHEHRFEAVDPETSILEDRITYQLPLGQLGAGQTGNRLDTLFAFRHQRTRTDLRRHLRTRLEHPMKIVVSGASGLVGRRLVPFLRSAGHEVRTLVRHTPRRPGEIFWDPAGGTIDAGALEGTDAIVHLAGASIASGRWTAARKRAIRTSRIDGTSLLATTLAHMSLPPRVFVSTSAVGYYGDRGAEELTEESTPGTGFLADVVQAWEGAADPARVTGIRVVHPRFGVVMAGEGGMLPLLARLFRAGLGGQLGDGQQYFAWIDLDDLVSILLESIINEELKGAVNAVAPQQVTNTEFTKSMGRVLNRPTIFRVPTIAMKLAAGDLADELILASQRVLPERLSAIGFDFAYPTLDASLRHELG